MRNLTDYRRIKRSQQKGQRNPLGPSALTRKSRLNRAEEAMTEWAAQRLGLVPDEIGDGAGFGWGEVQRRFGCAWSKRPRIGEKSLQVGGCPHLVERGECV